MSLATDQLTEAFRAQQLDIRTATIRDLLLLWPALNPQRLNDTFPAWLAAATQIIDAHSAASAASAGGYLTGFRMLEQITAPAPVLAPPAAAEKIRTSLLVTSVVAVKKSMTAGKPLDAAMRDAFVQSSGSASRLVLDAGRITVLDSLRHDPHAKGWERVTSGNACEFCDMLAGRGAVYSFDSADFEAHDHCACTAQPLY